MKISIIIKYNSPAGEVLQRGSFPLQGKRPESVAKDWWKQIQKKVYTEGLVEVTANGEDITDKVRTLLGK
ncbi:hypothetical protein M3182_03850 [Mesobacillus maritimus]|nr:hypothetical protein [Mesobacillus maritimus]